MTNRQLTADIIAKASVGILDNELVMGKKVFRGYEEEYNKNVNGYTVGETITITKPTDFTVRDGATASAQDVVEGKTTLTIDKQKGVDFAFTSKELTLNIKELSKRVLKPAMVQLANQIDMDLHALYKYVPNWQGSPASPINSFADFAKAPQILDEYAVPQDQRTGVLCPADHWGLVGSQTSLYNDTITKPAYRKGDTGMVGGVDLYMTQNVATHTVGAHAGTTLIDGTYTTSTIDYDDVKDTGTQTIHVDGFTSATAAIKAGDVITIEDVYAVNPVTKQPLSFLKQFTVTADATAATNEVDLVISPPMIWTGAQQTVSVTSGVTALDGKAVTFVGTAGSSYRQNMVFHPNAFALATIPMVNPGGTADFGRASHNGLNVRVIPFYDGTNDKTTWRLDVLYGVKAIDPRLATRISGTS